MRPAKGNRIGRICGSCESRARFVHARLTIHAVFRLWWYPDETKRDAHSNPNMCACCKILPYFSLFVFSFFSFTPHCPRRGDDCDIMIFIFVTEDRRFLKHYLFLHSVFLRIYEKPISILILISVRTVKFCHISSSNSHSRLIVHEEEDT